MNAWSKGLDARLVPWFRALVRLAQAMDRNARVSSGRRSRAEQARLYRRYLAGQSRFPAAPPGRSKHELGRAIDIVARPDVLRRLGAIWQRTGFTWGGSRDPIHFEG